MGCWGLLGLVLIAIASGSFPKFPTKHRVRKWDFEGPEDMKIDPPVIKDQRWFVGKSPN